MKNERYDVVKDFEMLYILEQTPVVLYLPELHPVHWEDIDEPVDEVV
jgi:hypothetical protein